MTALPNNNCIDRPPLRDELNDAVLKFTPDPRERKVKNLDERARIVSDILEMDGIELRDRRIPGTIQLEVEGKIIEASGNIERRANASPLAVLNIEARRT